MADSAAGLGFYLTVYMTGIIRNGSTIGRGLRVTYLASISAVMAGSIMTAFTIQAASPRR